MGLSHAEFAWHLPPSEKHTAHYLREYGYDTALVGFQHITTDQRIPDLGFSEWYLGGRSAVAGPNAVRWINHRASGEFTKPFYLEVAFDDTHRPWGKNPSDWSLGTERLRWLPPYPGSDQEMAEFQGDIFAIDQQVGAIVVALEQSGLRDNTWVLFTSDHGIDMPRAKGTLYDPGIEVPLIMDWPQGPIGSGQVINDLISHIDVLPTILAALNLPIPSSIQGKSLWPRLTGHSDAARTEIFAEKTYHSVYDPLRAIRTPTHKLIVHFDTYDTVDVPIDAKESPAYELMRRELTRPHRYLELFDLESDPLERDNLAFRSETLAVLDDHLGRLRRWMQETEDPLLRGPVPSPTLLRALDMVTGRLGLQEFLRTVEPR